MTRALPFTQASLQRAIKAARKAGLHITGIRADGTLMVKDLDNHAVDIAQDLLDGETDELSRWRDVQA